MDDNALYLIAEELRKLRVLKEYELGVLVGDDGDSHPTMEVTAGTNLRGDGSPVRGMRGWGDVLWNEDTGYVKRPGAEQ